MRSSSWPARADASCQRATMNRRNLILILASTTALSALALSAARARDVPKVATGFVANVVCTETFVSGLDPARGVRRDHRRHARHRADHLGAGLSRRSRAQGRHGDAVRPGPQTTPSTAAKVSAAISITAARSPTSRCRRPMPRRRCCPTSRARRIVAPQTPQLAAALDRAFAEPDKPTPRNTRAIVVMKDGRVVAEALCRRRRHRHAAARILRHQVGDLGARRHPGAQGRAEACIEPVPIAAWQRRRRSEARDHARSSAAPHRGACARQLAAGFARRPRWSRSTG